jgi:hypothetical protein
MRPEGRLNAGFFPQPLSEAERIRRFLQFEEGHTPALDPCVGEGAALAAIASGRDVTRYGSLAEIIYRSVKPITDPLSSNRELFGTRAWKKLVLQVARESAGRALPGHWQS